jgi:hypothetical protein
MQLHLHLRPVCLHAACVCVCVHFSFGQSYQHLTKLRIRSRVLLETLIVAQLVTSILQIPKLPCSVRKSRPLAPVMSQMSPAHNPPLYACFFIIILSGVRLSPLGTAATTGPMYQPQMVTVEQFVE